jgi:hypothetical protein
VNEREYHQMNSDLEAGEICAAGLAAILDCWGVETVERLDRAIYRYTACGPHLSVKTHDGKWHHSGNLQGIYSGEVRALLVGSIVEGSDADVTGSEIDLLTVEDAVATFNREVDTVDREANRLWDEANEEI